MNKLRLAEWVTICSIVIPSALGTITGQKKLVYSGSLIPTQYLFWSVASFLIVWNWSYNSRKYTNRSLLMLVFVAAFLWMIFLGIISNHKLKWIVLDCFCFGGLLVGAIWAIQIQWWHLIAYARRLWILAALMMVCGFLFPWLGLSASDKDAAADLKGHSLLWAGSFWFVYFLPTLYVSRKLVQRQYQQFVVLMGVLFATVSGLAMGFILVNRSIMVGIFLSVACLVRIISIKRKRIVFILLSFMTALLIVCALIASDNLGRLGFVNTRLFSKVGQKPLVQDPRAEEVGTILKLLEYNELTGLGFGSRYPVSFSYNIEGGWEGLAFAPHLGTFAFLQKGGYPIYICFVVVPFFFAAYRFLGPVPKDEVSLALWSQVLLYLTLSSCTTGGWSFIWTFFYGAFFTKALQYRPNHYPCSQGQIQ